MTLTEVQHAISEKNICVLVPTYNNEKTLRRVIDDILQYTCDIIIVNDGSTDSSIYRVKEFIEKNPELNIQLIHQENKGVSSDRLKM